MPAHIDADSEIYYSTEVEGYDGLIKTTAADLTAALAELTWENVAPTEDQIIAMYGDVVADEEILGSDYRSIQNFFLEKIEYNLKEYLTADVNDDSSIGGADYRMIQNFFLEKIDAFTAVTDRQEY